LLLSVDAGNFDDGVKLYRIGQTAEMAGVSKQSLQYYLLVGLLEPTRRSESGQQLFDDKAVKRIKLIKSLNASGYPLREIRDIFLKREQGGGKKR
jgi:MerR family copper efflux transcriptional regulator